MLKEKVCRPRFWYKWSGTAECENWDFANYLQRWLPSRPLILNPGCEQFSEAACHIESIVISRVVISKVLLYWVLLYRELLYLKYCYIKDSYIQTWLLFLSVPQTISSATVLAFNVFSQLGSSNHQTRDAVYWYFRPCRTHQKEKAAANREAFATLESRWVCQNVSGYVPTLGFKALVMEGSLYLHLRQKGEPI